MIIIGEKINGAIPSVGQAIKNRDEKFIRDLAVRQAGAGAEYLDVCAGTLPEHEFDALAWLLETVQDAADCKICLDSPDPRIIEKTLPLCKRPGLINSVSGEGDKCKILFPLMTENDWSVIMLLCDDNGIPESPREKIEIAVRLMEKASDYGIEQQRIFIDPLVMSIATAGDTMLQFAEVVREIKNLYPQIRTTSGLSNISYGMPGRKAINRGFITLALAAGMDSAIIDPTDRDNITAVLAAEALLGRDRHCRNYNRAYRQFRSAT